MKSQGGQSVKLAPHISSNFPSKYCKEASKFKAGKNCREDVLGMVGKCIQIFKNIAVDYGKPWTIPMSFLQNMAQIWPKYCEAGLCDDSLHLFTYYHQAFNLLDLYIGTSFGYKYTVRGGTMVAEKGRKLLNFDASSLLQNALFIALVQ